MKLAVGNYSFEVLPLEATLMVCKSLGFEHIVVAGFHDRGRCSFEPADVAANPQKQADILLPLLEKYQLSVIDYFTQFGAAPALHSLNDTDEAIRERNMDFIKGAAQFSHLIGSPGMTVIPGVDQVERSLAENLNVSIEYLRRAVDIAGEFGIEVRFEPHMGSIADTPELALQLVDAVPGLKIALDYAHFMLQYIPVERIHALLPHTGLVHVRQARYGKLQVAHAEGIIDYPDVISRLKAVGYDGALSCEYVCADWFEVNRNDTLYETSVAREMLLPYIQ
jgi:sugar phosphate isomerase/epimerase